MNPSLPPYPGSNSQKSGPEMDYHGMHRDIVNGVADALTRQPTRAASLTDAVSNVVDPLVNNGQAIGSALQGAMQVLDSLSDIGRALPFIAPAFVLFKIIIDLEKKAQDVDAKCNDLVERITFMLSHLPALQRVEIMAPTRQVSTLLVALASPTETNSRYAHRMKMTRLLKLSSRRMVEASMLNSPSSNTCNSTRILADSVQQNHARLEGILLENVSSAISGGLKNLALEFNALEAEQKFVCVQCEKDFTNYTNGPLACSFHRSEYDSWKKHYPCCSTKHPCQFGAHRAKHHCDYPYGTFFPRAWGVTRYVDTRTEWASVRDTNLETDDEQSAYVGQLLRWVSRGARLEENTIIVIVGRLWYQSPYYFNTFTAKELEDITKSVRLSRRTLIYRTSSNENEFAMAEWILSVSGKITAIRLTAKAATSTNPWVRVCPIDLSTCTKSGDILTTSEGGLRSYVPASPYVLPETVSFGPILNDEQTRAPRTNFKTRTTPTLRVILKSMSDPPLEANPQFANHSFDYLVGKFSIFNNNAPGSLNPITISSISAAYRLVGDPEYAPVKETKLLDHDYQLPATIDPRQSLTLNFQVLVPRTEEDVKLAVNWWNRAFVARNRPVRIKIIVEDIEGEQCSLVMEYVFKPLKLETRQESDLGFFFFDNPQTFTRNYLHVEKVNNKDSVIKIAGTELTVKRLKQMVYKALKTGKTDMDLEIGQVKDDGVWEWSAWALVDLSCRRVYAFKIMMHEGKKAPVRRMGTLGYVPCPEYGDVINKTRPVSHATESIKLPPMEPYVAPEYIQDDNLDDFKPPVPPKPATPTTEAPPTSATSLLNGATVSGIPADLTNRLISIDISLARIADALERLVAVLPAASVNGRAH
ncbi:hypothetical protein CPB84DRAFT_1781947 [Gymnopilus junonius]|uniref:Uncharacterized protein n=1 Tax=Gymnopilus junonius TaxID=109634 RepID=A0A9P5NIL7_GYMJU|nr:hypothetical protein CPB84DRAFT_1781947 [Gymnopilus junonius]